MFRKTIVTAAALAAVSLLGACASGGAGSDEPITIGVVGAADEQWKIFESKAEEAGIAVEIIDFQDYAQPNPALTQGELDLNQFQHLKYLSEYNVAADEDLVPIAATAVYPLGLYSKQYTSVEEIPEGAEIAIPNDPSNLARGLLVLQDAGLVALRDGGSAYSTEADVLPESRVKVTPVDAAQTAIALNSIAASIINNDFVADAGLEPSDALYQDDAASEGARPYINVWATKADDAENADYAKLIELFKATEVQDALVAQSGGTAVLANQTAAELQGYLVDIQADTAAAQG
ncbi:MAG: methionine ABC transporter substrate-binding protein [Actinomycetales bacterium]|nr:methionine ABC transporter substrate-binding protein [Actinomycetales bacterium]